MPLLPNKANTEGNNETLEDRTPVPAGQYPMHIVKSEFKATKAKTGHYLALQFRILDGPYKGKALFTNLNLDNPNQVAVEIANKELNSICKAVGKEGVEDSDELHQIPLLGTVKVTEGDAQYPPQNEITGYEAIKGEWPTQSAPAPQTTQEAQAEQPAQAVQEDQGKSKLPWE